MFRLARTALITALLFVSQVLAQDYTPKTTQDPGVEVATLRLQLNPLQRAEVEAEAQAWLDLLAAKNGEISQLEIAGDSAQLADRQAERAALVERLEVVVQRMDKLGSEAATVEGYVKYVEASTEGTIDLTGTSDLLATAEGWVTDPEKGIALGIDLLQLVVTLIAFWILARILAGIVRRATSRMKSTSELLRDFFVNIVRKLTILIGVVVALSMVGVNIGPFLAAIGAVGFIVGFALQGTLSNFAAGLMILIYRPYDLGEVITVAGKTGKVDAMSLVSTTLRLFDNQTVIVPNGSIWGDVITNVTSQATRRVDMVFGCGYDDDIQKVQAVFEDIITKHPKVLQDPAPAVKLHELGESSINFLVRPWTKTGDYWDVFWDVTREVKARFDKEGLNIPYPQRDVHMHQAAPK